jgi:hypothetical protein
MKHWKLSEIWKRMAALQMNFLVMLLTEDFSGTGMTQGQYLKIACSSGNYYAHI